MSAISPQTGNPDARCRKRYRFLAGECRRRGLSAAAIERSRQELHRQTGVACHLNEIAYKPTGVALGCPVPNAQFTRRLWHFSGLVEKYLRAVAGDDRSTFAFVPP